MQSEHLIAYHINNEYPVLLLTMRKSFKISKFSISPTICFSNLFNLLLKTGLEESWFERYNELRLECRAIVYETVANFQRKLNVQITDLHRRQQPALTVKGRGNVKQSMNNGRTYNTGIHVHRNSNNPYPDDFYRGRPSLTELVPGVTRGSASLTILSPADEANAELDYPPSHNHHHQNNQATYQRSPSNSNQPHTRTGQRTNQQRPTSTVKRKRKRPTNVNLFNQLDYELYPDGHSSVVNPDADGENGIEANSLAANHCDSVQIVPMLLLVHLALVFARLREEAPIF